MSEQPDIHKLNREDLNNYAGECGLPDAAEYATKADLIAAIEAKQAEAPADEGDAESEEPATEGDTYTVLKAITLDDGQTLMPGETVTIGADWPRNRAKQLIEQKYIEPAGD